MRVNTIRTLLTLACAFMALSLIALPAYGLSLPETPGTPQMFFPMNMYYKGQAGNMQSANAETSVSSEPNYSFFNSALGMLPAGDADTNGQMSAILQMKQSYQPQYTMPQSSSSWMSQFAQPSAIQEGSNPALSSYTNFLKLNPGMKNIFGES